LCINQFNISPLLVSGKLIYDSHGDSFLFVGFVGGASHNGYINIKINNNF